VRQSEPVLCQLVCYVVHTDSSSISVSCVAKGTGAAKVQDGACHCTGRFTNSPGSIVVLLQGYDYLFHLLCHHE